MNSTLTKFGVRFLTRKERTVRRVTKTETREIKKRLEPLVSPAVIKTIKVRRTTNPRPKPATLVKSLPKEKKKLIEEIRTVENEENAQSIVVRSSGATTNGRILQSIDLQKLTRLSCSTEFSLFHKEMKEQLKTNEHQLAFFQTKLNHLKNQFVDQLSQQSNLEQIREYFQQSLIQNQQREIKHEEFHILAEKLKQDIKQAIDKWLKKKEFGKQPKGLSEYSQKRQRRIEELIQETIQSNQKHQEETNPSQHLTSQTNDQSNLDVLCVD